MRTPALLLLLHAGAASAQQELDACLARLAADARFAPIAAKLAVGTQASAAPAMLAESSRPDARQKRAIALWAAERSECVKIEARYGSEDYRPPLQAYRLEAENKVLEAAIELHEGGQSFGTFNRRRQAIAEELRVRREALSRRIQDQRDTQRLTDQQASDRQQLQKALEDVERQAAMAQQETARRPRPRATGAGQPYQAYRRGAPYGSCFPVGGRIVCTYR